MKNIYQIIHKFLAFNDGDFCHLHIEEFVNDKNNAIKLLNRLVRRGVLLRIHKNLYVRNTKRNKLTYST